MYSKLGLVTRFEVQSHGGERRDERAREGEGKWRDVRKQRQEQRATEEARIWRDGEIEGELVER